jgi:4-hydroxybenzoate polyprenyltransferase
MRQKAGSLPSVILMQALMKEKILNYIKLTRLNQPTGILLLFLPCLFGIFLSLKRIPDFDLKEVSWIIFLFFAGSVIMRSAGCIINDLFDQKFDEKIGRTKIRPLAAKKISRLEALILLALLLFLGLLILLQFNFKTILSGFLALILVITYPLMKRITYYPQFFLGLTFNFGILMASLAILERIDLAAILLYVGTIFWTLIYDTIYAFQDIEDDLRVGVKSIAIKFKNNPKKILFWLNFAMFLSLICVGIESRFGPSFFLIIWISTAFLNQKIKNCDFKNPKICLRTFKENIAVGVLIAASILAG